MTAEQSSRLEIPEETVVVPMPEDVEDGLRFRYRPGCPVLFDLTGTRYLASDALPDLVRVARRVPTFLLVTTGSHPERKLTSTLFKVLRTVPGSAAGQWLMQLCPEA